MSPKHTTRRWLNIENIIGDAQDHERLIFFSQTHAVISERARPYYRTSTIGPNCLTVIPWEGQILVFGLSAKV
jgi:hypothetical protein